MGVPSPTSIADSTERADPPSRAPSGTRVLLLSRYDRTGASSRVRFYQYLPSLKREGIEVTVAPLLPNRYLADRFNGRRPVWPIVSSYLRRLSALVRSRHFDCLWIEGELWPWLPGWGEAQLARLGLRYVVDYDDAIFHRYDAHPNPFVRHVLGAKIDRVMRDAAVVIVGSEYLAQRARRAGAHAVEQLPTVVDLERYPHAPTSRNPVFTIGWVGSPVSAAHLRLIQPALADVCRGGQAQLRLVGSRRLDLGEIPVEVRNWSEQTEVADIASFDVGIMPLRDEPMSHGKCGYKLIQYMACSRPAVASPLGANVEILTDGVEGFHAKSTEEWVIALRRLARDPELREAMGRAGRSKVEARYSVEVTAARLASLLQRAAQGS